MNIIEPSKSRRRGTITHEATIAVVLATAVIGGTVQILAVLSLHRRDLDRRATALREAGNLLEEIAARPWNELTEENLSALALSDQCREILREPSLKITVTPETAGTGKHISVEIDWRSAAEQRTLPLKLSTWRYPQGETTP